MTTGSNPKRPTNNANSAKTAHRVPHKATSGKPNRTGQVNKKPD